MVKFYLPSKKDGLMSLLVRLYISACVHMPVYKQKRHNEISNMWMDVEHTISGF